MSDNFILNKLRKPIESLIINKGELLKLLHILQERANSACDIECNHIESFAKAEDLEKSKKDLRSCSFLKITITGSEGEELFGTIDEVFSSLSFPEQVYAIYLNSELLYKSQFNYIPRNRFEVYIDFRKPKVLDFSFDPSEKTPNDSNFSVEGFDNTWVNGVFREIDKFIDRKTSRFHKIHKTSFYDLIVWIIGLPMSFWVCAKLSTFITVTFSSIFLQNALFVYMFLLTLLTLRVMFHYFRWLYPKIEYDTKRSSSRIHRGFLITITIGIIGAFLYDIIKLVFK